MRFILDFIRGITNGFGEIWAHKTRSLLSMMGIILGVAALVGMLSIMEDMMAKMRKSFEEFGGIEVATIGVQEVPAHQADLAGLSKGLTLDDSLAIKKAVRLITGISPESRMWGGYFRSLEGRPFNMRLLATNADRLDMLSMEIDKGRNFGDIDMDNKSTVVIVGSYLVKSMFKPNENPIGKTIKILGVPYTIIGTIKESVYMSGKRNILEWKNRFMFIPITTAIIRHNGARTINNIYFKVDGKDNLPVVVEQVQNIMTQMHNGIEDFEVDTKEDKLADIEKRENQFLISFGGIALISLIVGGMGIMNVMLAVINERIREIGVRKAVGAKGYDIFVQFLAESAVISFLGGIIGMAVSIGLVYVLANILEDSSEMVVPLHALLKGLGFSVIIGLLAGIYPALKASKLDPIEALRYE